MTSLRSTLTADTEPLRQRSAAVDTPEMNRTQHTVAVVTGASSGIGEHIARRLAERGYTTILMARRRELLQQLAEDNSRHAPSEIMPVDLADADHTRRVIDQVLDRWGTPHVLVNCAGVGLYRTFLDHSAADHQRIMRINYHAAADLIHAALPGMLQRRSGLVVNVASISVKMSPWGHGAYTASKAALVALTQTLSAEYGHRGVNFTYVNPGIVRTPYFETGTMSQLWPRVKHHAIAPDHVARRIVSLIDRPRLELNVPGHYRILDLFKAVSPGALHSLITRHSRPE